MKNFSLQEQERSWVNEGVVHFMEILRTQKNTSLKNFFDNTIASLVKCLSANQGAIFLVNYEYPKSTSLDLVASYTPNGKKFSDKRVEWSESVASQVVLERNTIYLMDVPSDFVKISSGLGEALPQNILLVPLKMGDDVFGVVEIASFQHFKRYQIEFVEKLGESIAATVAKMKADEGIQ